MHLHRRRVRSGAGRAIEPREQRVAALALVFDIFDTHPGSGVRACFGFERRRHVFSPIEHRIGRA